jgi:hypothetical protein
MSAMFSQTGLHIILTGNLQVLKCICCIVIHRCNIRTNINQKNGLCICIHFNFSKGCSSSDSVVIKLWTGHLEFDSWQGLGFFLLATVSRLAVGPTQPPIQWVPEVLSPGVKWLGHVADHSLPSSAKVQGAWSYTSTAPICLHGVVLN